MTTSNHALVEQFLTERCDVTGRPTDQVRASVLLVSYQDWAFDRRVVPMPDRSFFLTLRDFAGGWKHPHSGFAFASVKASVSTYRGLLLREAL
jgi:hypothetical protein